MSKEKLRYSLWECELCNDIFITDSKKRWSMVSCKCGKTSVDDEEGIADIWVNLNSYSNQIN